jgi:hypothetical protein
MSSTARRGGKRHARATRANDSRLADFVKALDAAKTSDDLAIYMTRNATQLARVIKNHGGSQLEIQLQDGTIDKFRISKTISIRGRSGTKTHLEYVMARDDVVLFTGGMVSAKMPHGFFAIGDIKEEADADEDGWGWDISKTEAAKGEAAIARIKAHIATASLLGGGHGTASRDKMEVVMEEFKASGGAGTAAADDSDDDDIDIDAL